MKKLITVATLATVALSAEFLRHHPTTVKDETNIVKNVPAHKYDKLIKHGIKISKDLNLEDQEFFSTEDTTIEFKKLKEKMAEWEKKNQLIQKQLSELKKTDPVLYEEELKIYNQVMPIAEMKKLIKPVEKLMSMYENPSLYTEAIDFEDLYQNFEEAVVATKQYMPNKNFQILEKNIKEGKELGAVMKKGAALLKAFNVPVDYSQIPKTLNNVRRSQIQADDEELFHLDDLVKNGVQHHKDLVFEDQEFFSTEDMEIQIKKLKEMLVESEKLEKKHKEARFRTEDTDSFYEELNKKGSLSDMDKGIELLETTFNMLKKHRGSSEKLKTLRSSQIQADDDELFTFQDLIDEGTTLQQSQIRIEGVQEKVKNVKDMIANIEKNHKNLKENLELVKNVSPKDYEKVKAHLENEEKALDSMKRNTKFVEKTINALSKVHGFVMKFESLIQADDEELFHLDGLKKKEGNINGNLAFEDQEFFSTQDLDVQLQKAKQRLAEMEKLQEKNKEMLALIKDSDPAAYEDIRRKQEILMKEVNLSEIKKSLEFAEKMKNLMVKPGGSLNKLQNLRSSQIQVDDDELFNLGKLIKEGKSVREEIKNHRGMI